METNNELIDEINSIKNNYFANVNTIFNLNKSKHKLQCAKQISEKIDLDKLLTNTAFRISNTNKVFFDYPMFKTFANPETYDYILEHVLKLSEDCIRDYGTFEMHINLKSFSVSAAERYKICIECFIKKCISKKTPFVKTTDKVYIYNTPNVLDGISRLLSPFIEPEVRDKITFFDKNVSPEMITSLIVNNNCSQRTSDTLYQNVCSESR